MRRSRSAIQLVKAWQASSLETIEARKEAMYAWAAMLKSKMSHMVWASGCNSWYLDADGDPLTWPDTWKAWLTAKKEPDLNDFHLTEPPTEEQADDPVQEVA